MPAVISDAAFSYSEVKVRGRYQLYPCENFYEISPRSRRDLGENRGEIAARSRRVFGRRDFPISPRSRRDHGEIGEISAAKNSPRSRRDSRRDAGNLGGQKRAAILPRFSPRCGKSRRPKTRRDLAEIAARYGNLGRQIRGEMLQ